MRILTPGKEKLTASSQFLSDFNKIGTKILRITPSFIGASDRVVLKQVSFFYPPQFEDFEAREAISDIFQSGPR